MAGLSSIMAITRPLGEVSLEDMNRCVGVYRVYMNGGGGGGGGYDSFYMWYGGQGSSAQFISPTVSLVPPITLSPGLGGAPAVDEFSSGGQGGNTTMSDSRGSNILASGYAGGRSATSLKASSPVLSPITYSRYYRRFTMQFRYGGVNPSNYHPIEPQLGQGGATGSYGRIGGMFKAFRIG